MPKTHNPNNSSQGFFFCLWHCLVVHSYVYCGSGDSTVCIIVCILFVDLSFIGAFTLQRTKAVYPIIFDFIWLMHCYGCTLGRVLLVIKCMCQFLCLLCLGGGGRVDTGLPVSMAWGTARTLSVFYSLHIRKTISTVSSRECFVQGYSGLRCVSDTPV